MVLWPRKFANEGAAVGRILTGYINLELSLMHCVQNGCGDFDTVLKKMFKRRGEKARLEEAEKLGAPAYKKLKLETQFRKAIRDLRHCLKIRNQYAHWIWWDDNTGKLAFANLEDLAKRKRRVTNLDKLKAYHLDPHILAEQESYFVYVDQLLGWINFEGRVRSKPLKQTNPISKPKPPRRPKLRL
jgi:hypothetical protein